MSTLAQLILDRHVQRRDVYAVQSSTGAYRPVEEDLTVEVIQAHLDGHRTIGHYTSDQGGLTRVLAFDVDLEEEGTWTRYPLPEQFPDLHGAELDRWMASHSQQIAYRPREAWLDRTHPSRGFVKYMLRTVGEGLAYGIRTELGLHTAIAYSGHKGIHVYGYTEPVDVAEARAGCELALDAAGPILGGQFELSRGKNFFKLYSGPAWADSFAVETFPKQSSMDGKKFGNLMRLPLGRNLKNPGDPCFFVDRTAAYSHLGPMDPQKALDKEKAWT